MCGPSKALKNLNSTIQNFSNQVVQQAGTVFGNDSSVFNQLMTSYGKLVAGGPNQQGFDQTTLNRLRSGVIENAATSFRNIKAAVGNATAAIGGGNEVLPSGASAGQNAAIAAAVEGQKSGGLSNIDVKNTELGRENYFAGLKGEQEAPSVFNNVSSLDQAAQAGLNQAQISQKNIDASNNWWQPMLMKGISAGASFLTGGLSNLGAGESFGEGVGDFFKGGLSNVGGGGQ